ncbi:MAG: CatA-like O-acetyltransferase [Lachnospiraceae bacterium]|nr:CatA-like O-acetyltransferase [Lachnospiraceae bacterium]
MNDDFEPVDMEKWERREHFWYYTNTLRTSYQMNVDIDITVFYNWTRGCREIDSRNRGSYGSSES